LRFIACFTFNCGIRVQLQISDGKSARSYGIIALISMKWRENSAADAAEVRICLSGAAIVFHLGKGYFFLKPCAIAAVSGRVVVW